MDGGEAVERDGRRAETSYVSTEAVIVREAAVVVRDLEGRPGYWRPFVVRHLVVTALFIGTPLALSAFGYGDSAGAARGMVLAFVVMAGITAFDLWQVRRRVRRAVRTHHRAACPPGTSVHARWTSADVLFRVPGHEVRLELRTVTAARHVSGVLLLDQAPVRPAFVVPDELLGPDALAILRDTLGTRWREQL